MKQALVKKWFVVVAGLLVTASSVWAKPQMSISITTSKEVMETVNGVKLNTSVPVQSAVSGDTLTFTIYYNNIGNETATNAVVDNPISSETSYIDNSVTGASADISFSIDAGKNFKKASDLTYAVKHSGGSTENITARPEEYTDIRWTIKAVPPGSSGILSYKVKIK